MLYEISLGIFTGVLTYMAMLSSPWLVPVAVVGAATIAQGIDSGIKLWKTPLVLSHAANARLEALEECVRSLQQSMETDVGELETEVQRQKTALNDISSHQRQQDILLRTLEVRSEARMLWPPQQKHKPKSPLAKRFMQALSIPKKVES